MLNNNFKTASADAKFWNGMDCKNLKSTKAALESLLSERQLKIEAQAAELVDSKAKLKSTTKKLKNLTKK